MFLPALGSYTETEGVYRTDQKIGGTTPYRERNVGKRKTGTDQKQK